MHALQKPFSSPEMLRQSVIQAGELLGLYRAEVARILGLQCEQIAALYDRRLLIEPDSVLWQRSVIFVSIYQNLFHWKQGDGPRMVNWLRRDSDELAGSPFALMVDLGRAEQVNAYLRSLLDTA